MDTSSLSFMWTELKPAPDAAFGVPCARSSHGVSVVRDGSCLIVYGGEHVARTPISDGDLDDTNNKEEQLKQGVGVCWAVDDLHSQEPKWRRIHSKNSGSFPPERIAHAQAVYNDSRVYVFGGRQGITMSERPLNDLWMLDCSGEAGSEKWSQVETTGSPPEPRSFHRMICIGSNLFVFGGCGSSGRMNDLYQLNLKTNTWTSLGNSSLLRGRGGPNLIPLSSGNKIAVIAGFAGEETKDGHVYDLLKNEWSESPLTAELDSMRPRSVCVSGAFPSSGVAIIFGGEVDPSDRGHEGAGGFENDIVILDECTCVVRETILKKGDVSWPQQRGWADASVIDKDGKSVFLMFGGLSGDDANPKRLDDLWQLTIQK